MFDELSHKAINITRQNKKAKTKLNYYKTTVPNNVYNIFLIIMLCGKIYTRNTLYYIKT